MTSVGSAVKSPQPIIASRRCRLESSDRGRTTPGRIRDFELTTIARFDAISFGDVTRKIDAVVNFVTRIAITYCHAADHTHR